MSHPQEDLYAGITSTGYTVWKEVSVHIQATQLDVDRV